MSAEVDDVLEDQEFFELMQAYRHVPLQNQKAVVETYEAVKEYIRTKFTKERQTK